MTEYQRVPYLPYLWLVEALVHFQTVKGLPSRMAIQELQSIYGELDVERLIHETMLHMIRAIGERYDNTGNGIVPIPA